MKLSASQIEILRFAANVRHDTALTLTHPLDRQKRQHQIESDLDAKDGLPVYPFEQWLAACTDQVDAIQCDAPIYLVADHGWVQQMTDPIEWAEPRIVFWGDKCIMYGGDQYSQWTMGSPLFYYGHISAASEGAVHAYWLSHRKNTAVPHTQGQRLALARARIKPSREFYYVAADASGPKQPAQEAKGGHHSSPVAHLRRAHQALLSYPAIEPSDVEDLVQRGYTIGWEDQVPPDVRSRMLLRGKAPKPAGLCAWRWIDRPAMRVNPHGDQARKVTVVSAVHSAYQPN